LVIDQFQPDFIIDAVADGTLAEDLDVYDPTRRHSRHIREIMGITIQVGNIACGEKDVKNRTFRKILPENFIEL